MTNRHAIINWLRKNDAVFDDLRLASASIYESGQQARQADQSDGVASSQFAAAMIDVEAAASRMQDVVDRARVLRPIPDDDANEHFQAALVHWSEAARTLVTGALDGNRAAIDDGITFADVGSDEFLLLEVALRRATSN